MKRRSYNSLREFYADITAPTSGKARTDFISYEVHNSESFKGLAITEINRSKYGYEVGVEKLRHFKDVEVEKDTRVKYWNQFDGYDIDVDRMYDNLDFLLDTRRQRKLPKTMDIYVNIGENRETGYDKMLNKTYTAIKVIDRLESLGVRCAVYACAPALPVINTSLGKDRYGELNYLEICVKNYHDALNTGAICAAISPWMLRHWIFLWRISHIEKIQLDEGLSYSQKMPADTVGIIIETGSCLEISEANRFIETIKVA